MGRVTEEVQALLQQRQDRRKAELDASRRDVQFDVGDKVLLDTGHTPSPSRSLHFPRWMCPFPGLPCPRAHGAQHVPPRHTHHVARLPRVNVERLRPYIRRPALLGGDTDGAPPLPVLGADGSPEHEAQELVKFKMRYCRPYVLVHWAGFDAAGDTWEPLDNLTKLEAAIAAFRALSPTPADATVAGASPRQRRRAPADPPVDAAPPGDLGAGLVGRTVLYWWPDDGWQRGTVARLCARDLSRT